MTSLNQNRSNADYSNATVTVTSTAELKAALASLSQGSGGTILVDGSKGPYIIEAQNLGLENAGVLITPLDEDVQPHVYQVDILNSSNITVHGMKIDSRAIDDTRDSWDYDVNVLSSKSISIVGNDFQSDGVEIRTESNGAVQGERAIIARNSEDVTLTHNTIVDYSAAIVYLEVKGLDISHNDISGIQGDGLAGGGIQDVTITHNHIHDFHGSTQTMNHSDMIQIWGTNAQTQASNIEISHNVLDAGNGAATQSILIQNESFPTNGWYFQDISIHNNIIHNGMAQGIGTRYVEGLEVYDNTVLWNEASTYLVRDGDEPGTSHPRLILRHSPDADVYGNIVSESIMNEVLIPNGDNYIIEYGDDGAENYVGNHFVNLSGQGDLSLQDLSILPDSPLRGEFGGSLSSTSLADLAKLNLFNLDKVSMFAIDMKPLNGATQGVSLKAYLDFPLENVPSFENVKATWVFSDGRSTTGLETTHVFNEVGIHTISLSLELDGNPAGTVNRQFYAPPSELFSIEFNGGIRDTSLHDSDLRLHKTELMDDAGRNGDAFFLDGDSRLHVERSNVQFTNLETFELEVGFNPAVDSGGGVIAMLHRAWNLKSSDAGFLTFNLTTDEGTFSVASSSSVIKSGEWQDIVILYDSLTEKLQLLVNGETVGVSQANGSTTGTTGYDIVLGAYWEKSAQGLIDHLAMTSPTSSIYEVLTTIPWNKSKKKMTMFPLQIRKKLLL